MDLEKIILDILVCRGIDSTEAIEEFLARKPKKTYDPFLLKDMEKACEEIVGSVKANRKICIYGDYDADGVTSVVILYQFLNSIGGNVSYYIPERIEEGYGLNKKAIEYIKSQGNDLIITVDCGIVSADEVEFANEIGLDVIITDHHTAEGCVPNCIAINPKQQDCNYPFENLAGCGVVFKLIQAICHRENLNRGLLKKALDLVAIGTIADVVPVIDENRTMIKYGLNQILTDERPGIRAIRRQLNQNLKKITGEDISFGIAPVINAAGRMSHADLGVKLLLTEDASEAEEIKDELFKLNSKRKSLQKQSLDIAMNKIEESVIEKNSSFPMLFLEDVHEGIMGIVAGQLKDKIKKPVAILTRTDEEPNLWKGSSRTAGGVNIYEILSQSRELFEKFGGHKAACGFSIKEENFARLREKTETAMENMDLELLEKDVLHEDVEIALGSINSNLVNQLELFEPFGQGNNKPIFKIAGGRCVDLKLLGDGSHAGFNLKGEANHIRSIVFRKAKEYYDVMASGEEVVIYGTLSKNLWENVERIQIIAERIEKADGSIG